MKKASTAELRFMRHWKIICGQPYVFDTFKFHETRKWRFDFAFEQAKVAVEIEGGIWKGKLGGHTSGVGYTNNCEKYNEATLLGWTIFRLTPAQIQTPILTRIKQYISNKLLKKD